MGCDRIDVGPSSKRLADELPSSAAVASMPGYDALTACERDESFGAIPGFELPIAGDDPPTPTYKLPTGMKRGPHRASSDAVAWRSARQRAAPFGGSARASARREIHHQDAKRGTGAEVVRLDDVRVPKAGRERRLVLEHHAKIVLLHELGAQLLQHDVPARPSPLRGHGEKDVPHPATVYFGDDPVGAEHFVEPALTASTFESMVMGLKE
jgi:hypothetical protein